MILERGYFVLRDFCSTDMILESKRKAVDQLRSESPKKRIKNSHSTTITPEAESKPRVVPFPEKVRAASISDLQGCCLTVIYSLPS